MAITGNLTLAQDVLAAGIRPWEPALKDPTQPTARPTPTRSENDQDGASALAPEFATAPIPPARSAGWSALSLFSGCGGLDLGFLQQGIFASTAYDVDQKALATHTYNLATPGRAVDLAQHTPATPDHHVLLAGAPCQGFSTAGKRQVEDPRNALLMRVADIALQNRSRVIVVENVPAAISGAHKKLWEAFEDRLRLAGYNVRRIFVEGATCGLAQRRRRLFLLCWRGSDCLNIRLPDQPQLKVRDALRGLSETNDNDVEWPQPGTRDWLVAQRVAAGHRLSNVRLSDRTIATWDIPEVYGETTHHERELLTAVARLRRRDRVRATGDGDPVSAERLEEYLHRPVQADIERLVVAGYLRLADSKVELKQTYNGRYRRVEWDALSPTVDTRFGRMDLFLHPNAPRGFTPREAARIQGFPDAFEFLGSRAEKFVQIGNAVPPPMAAALSVFVREAILKA